MERSPYPPSAVGVETAVPAFIGYTEKAEVGGMSAVHTPVRIASYREFDQHFGKAPRPSFTLEDVTRRLVRSKDGLLGSLPGSLRLFYANGGGPCYIVSVGPYKSTVELPDLMAGLEAIRATSGPTMLVIPDASLLNEEDFGYLARAMMAQASARQDRVALLDVRHARDLPPTADANTLGQAITAFRAAMGTENLSYGMAYFPYLNTTVVQPADIDATWFDAGQLAQKDAPGITRLSTQAASILNLLPASAAMAGVMTAVDAASGVWTAPANITLNAVSSVALRVDDESQADLNRPLDGRAINVIREFPGRGPVVWGARTLDGNSNDYRYVQVRRTVIYLEQSIKACMSAFVVAPNDGATWVSVVAMVSAFLERLWANGGLMGVTPQEAFSVNCGLGSTMTAQDVLDGYMVVQVLVQVIHPSEFIELTFKQKMEPAG